MNIPLTLVKATGLSAILFWAIIFTNKFNYIDTIPFVFLSLIPISICCALVICLTIAPFYWSKHEDTRYKTVYNTYFPFYAIIIFSLCLFGSIQADFDTHLTAFFASAFITTSKSWEWLAKTDAS